MAYNCPKTLANTGLSGIYAIQKIMMQHVQLNLQNGTVADRAMSVVNEGDKQGRAYISITTDTGDIQFWLTKDCETNAQIGDKVIVESVIEEQTNLLVATKITVE